MNPCNDPTCWRTPHDRADHSDPAKAAALGATHLNVTVKTYINDGPGRFDGYQPGDILTEGPTLVFAFGLGVTNLETEALNRAWIVGNRAGQADAAPMTWPATVRSLSVADVLVIGETAWAVDRFGFKPVAGDDLARSLGPDALVSDRGASPWTRAL